VLLVAAAAGYGKTTRVRAGLRGEPARWHTGAAAASALRAIAADASGGTTGDSSGGAARRPETPPQWLVLDDPSAARETVGDWLASVLTAPTAPPVILITRRVPDARLAKSRMSGLLTELGPAELALSAVGVSRLLSSEYGLTDSALADRLHGLVHGWPALVHLAARSLTAGSDLDERTLTARGNAVADYLIEEVLDGLDESTRYLLALAAHIGPLTVELAEELDASRVDEHMAELTRLGLIQPAPFGPPRLGIVPLLGAVLRRHHGWPQAERVRLLKKAAAWYEASGEWGRAARALAENADTDAVRRLLTEQGSLILAREGMRTLIELSDRVPRQEWTAQMRLAYGEALALAGAPDAARSHYLELAGDAAALTPALARRLGYLDYRAGDFQSALRVFARARLEREDTADEAMLLAWTSVVHWSAGSFPEAAAYAVRAQRAAMASGDYRPRIAAHLALGFTAEVRGEPETEQRHYDAALELAEANGDAIQTAMARNNRASRLLGEGKLAEALAEADRAVRIAEAVDLHAILGMALTNSGGALRQLGRLDEALERFERALAVEHRAASSWLAYPLADIGDIHRIRGRAQQARAAYEEAIRIAEASRDRYGLVPALAGLARTLAEQDAHAGSAAAERAVELAAGPMTAKALIAAGHCALGLGNRDRALELAQDAAAQARAHRDRMRLAEALELLGASTDSAPQSGRALAEALEIWRERKARLDAYRVEAMIGSRVWATAAQRSAAAIAGEKLTAAQVAVPHYATPRVRGPEVEITTLGRFVVTVAGQPVPSAAWQSRKARDLLRILVARRGRPVPRDELGRLLWGDDDAARVSHRLSVALSTIRTVLDPRRAADPDHFMVAAAGSVFLDVTRVTVDVERFLADAEHGLRLRERGEAAAARGVLELAERAYTGDFLEDDPYGDTATRTRELARATYLQIVRVLVELSRQDGDADSGVRYLHRILAKDPYDEQSHRDLIEILEVSGSHGEARRAQERYTEAMRELGL